MRRARGTHPDSPTVAWLLDRAAAYLLTRGEPELPGHCLNAHTGCTGTCSANNLATDLRALGNHEHARQLDQDTLTRRRRVLGQDHPDTLCSAINLAADLRALGENDQAGELDDDTLIRCRRVLGEDYPTPCAEELHKSGVLIRGLNDGVDYSTVGDREKGHAGHALGLGT